MTQRGWTLDMLTLVRRISESREAALRCPRSSQCDDPTTFTNENFYAHARELGRLQPDNRDVRDKIRQQLQVLREAGLLIHVSVGLALAVVAQTGSLPCRGLAIRCPPAEREYPPTASQRYGR